MLKEDVVVRNDEPPKPEQDRFSVVVMANYVQWDAPVTSLTVRSGRLVDESKSPSVIPKITIKKGERIPLSFGMGGPSTLVGDLYIVNKNKEAKPSSEGLPGIVAVYRDVELEPFTVVKPGRFSCIDPTRPLQLEAYHADVEVGIYYFPE